MSHWFASCVVANRTERARRWLVAFAAAIVAQTPAIGMAQTGLTPLTDAKPAPGFSLPDLDNKLLDLRALQGRVVVVNFWATWCPPCRKELPSLGRLQKLFPPDQLLVVGINVGEDADTVFAFAGDPGFTLVLDRDSRAMQTWPLMGLPTTFVIDRQGRIVMRAVGGREFDSADIVDGLRKLVAAGAR